MLIAGWGKNAKNLGTVGLHRCERCHNPVLVDLYEVKKKVSLYFVPVAKWDSHFFLICTTCDGSIEITRELKDKLLQESLRHPPPETLIEIWNDVIECLGKVSSDDESGDVLKAKIGEMRERLAARYSRDHVDYVLSKYLELLRHDGENSNG